MGKCTKLWVLTLLIFSIALGVRANSIGKEEGILHGYVTDAVTKKPLPGVVVSAIIPGSGSQKEVTTDADGYFRFPKLPASQVTVKFDKKGYQSCKRPNVTVKEKTVKLNVEFIPEDTDAESDNSEYPLLRLLQAS